MKVKDFLKLSDGVFLVEVEGNQKLTDELYRLKITRKCKPYMKFINKLVGDFEIISIIQLGDLIITVKNT